MSKRTENRRAYSRVKQRARARSAEVTLAGQDIAPLPAVSDPDRRSRADSDFRFFCETYFPHVFTWAWSDDHLRVLGKIERVVRDRDTLAVAMPRGSGKTTLSLMAVLWAILSGQHHFVMLIGATKEKADELLESIQTHLSSPPESGGDPLLADYPETVYPIRCLEGEARRCNGQRYYGKPTQIGWGVDEVVLPTIPGSRSSGAIVRVAGLGGNIRGALYVLPSGRQVRPTLAVCDDPQTDQSAASMLQTSQRLRIINGAVMGLAGPGERTGCIVPCTVIQPDDLADQLLDRERNPEWRGERTKMLNKLPADEKLWSEYGRIRSEEFASDGDGSVSTAYYLRHRAAMDAGAEVAWPDRYDRSRGELSALQHAMNIRLRDEDAFWAEYQNEPRRGEHAADTLSPIQVCNRANGRPVALVPPAATRLTMFIDVHDKLLFYCVCAWEENFTGYVIEYGTFPQQNRRSWAMAQVTRTLATDYPGAGPDGAIQAGLESLVSTYVGRNYKRGTGLMRIGALLVDSGYKPGIVEAVRHKAGGSAMQSYRGLGIRAGRRPMSSYQRRPGEVHGHYWLIPNVRRTGEFPHVAADVNYWKTFVHTALATAPGDPGNLTLYGKADQHELFAQHVAGSETWVETIGYGRVVREWTLKPSKPDNHWFDCLVGCAVAASVSGLTVPGQAAVRAGRRRNFNPAALTREGRRQLANAR